MVERLTAALNEGRLELVEYDDRVRQVYAAKTAGELVPITADLPAPVPPAAAQAQAQHPHGAHPGRAALDRRHAHPADDLR